MPELTATQKVRLLTAQIEQMKIAHEAAMEAERLRREQTQKALQLFESGMGNLTRAIKELRAALE